jgi:hypothetical protein
MSDPDHLLAELSELKDSERKPFPYLGCRRLHAAVQGRCEGLIPDLDMYLSEIAGYRSWGKRIITRWSDEKIANVERRLQDSFFDRHPEYAELVPILNSSVAPDVSGALEVADRTRHVLRELLSIIRRNRVWAPLH